MQIKYVFIGFPTTTGKYRPIYYIEIERAEGYINSLIPVAMVQQMADFIKTYCRCSFCHKQVLQSLARCSCEQQISGRICVEFPKEIFESIFIPLFEYQRKMEGYARKALSRSRKILGAGKYTNQEIDLLLLAQEGLCYYCAVHLVNEDGKPKFHIDHYIPLAEGGHNEISNLVLSCPPCNLRKGIEEGSKFIRRVSKTLDLAARVKAKLIRKHVKLYKKKMNSNE